MGFPFPATDYAESRLSIDAICNVSPNTLLIETATGYCTLDQSLAPCDGSYCYVSTLAGTDFICVHAGTLVSRDGGPLGSDELEGAMVLGVVTHELNRTYDDGRPV